MATCEWAQSHSLSLNKDTVQKLGFLKSSRILQHRSQQRNFSKAWRSHIILRTWTVQTQQRAGTEDGDPSDRQLQPPGCSVNICCTEWHGKLQSGVLSTAKTQQSIPTPAGNGPSLMAVWLNLTPWAIQETLWATLTKHDSAVNRTKSPRERQVHGRTLPSGLAGWQAEECGKMPIPS